MTPQPIAVVCPDGFRLHGASFLPPAGHAKQTVIICPATGVPQTFYYAFAKYLAENGINTLVYDYRGVGKSRPASLRGFHASLQHWIEDLGAVTRYVHEKFPSTQLTVFGHSIGGVLGLVNPAKSMVTRLVTVGAQTSFWKDWPARLRYRRFLVWHVFIPLVTRIFGYFPGRRLNMGEDLPYEYALEWGYCWRHRDGLLGWSTASGWLSTSSEVVVVGVTDDTIGTSQAIENLHRRVTAKNISRHWIRPADHGLTAIGHFDLFREKTASKAWPTLLRLMTGPN